MKYLPLSAPPDRGRYFRAILMTLISDGARSMIFEPENSALARSQGPEEPVLDSCKFQGFVAKFSRYIPLSGVTPGPIGLGTHWRQGSLVLI